MMSSGGLASSAAVSRSPSPGTLLHPAYRRCVLRIKVHAAQRVVSRDELLWHTDRREREGHHDPGPVLAGRAVHQRGQRTGPG